VAFSNAGSYGGNAKIVSPPGIPDLFDADPLK
jgi:hypothetical protein